MAQTARELEPSPLMTAREAAAYLRLSLDYIYDHKHVIGAVRFGRAVRFRREDLDRFIHQSSQNTSAEIARIDVRKL